MSDRDLNRVHVTPNDDPTPHDTDHGHDCWCEPAIEQVLDDETGAEIGVVFVHSCLCRRLGMEHPDGVCPPRDPGPSPAD